MVKFELFMTNGDRRVLERRAAHLAQRLQDRADEDNPNAPGTGFDRGELSALRRLLSQVVDKGVEV